MPPNGASAGSERIGLARQGVGGGLADRVPVAAGSADVVVPGGGSIPCERFRYAPAPSGDPWTIARYDVAGWRAAGWWK
jgi:hypothetical protein